MSIKPLPDGVAEAVKVVRGPVYGDPASCLGMAHAGQKLADYIQSQVSRIASLEAHLSACTKAHYGKMAADALVLEDTRPCQGQFRHIHDHIINLDLGRKPMPCKHCRFGSAPGNVCTNTWQKTYVITKAGDSCTGFTERPQTQGL